MKKITVMAAALALMLAVRPCAAAEVVTNEDIRKYMEQNEDFSSAHAVMSSQRRELHSMLDGFLLGDADLIKQSSRNVAAAMNKVVRQVPIEHAQEAAAWAAMSKIVGETITIEERLGENDYPGAYNSYVRMASQCIRCHQAVRGYGTFVEPEPDEPAPVTAPAETPAPTERKQQ